MVDAIGVANEHCRRDMLRCTLSRWFYGDVPLALPRAEIDAARADVARSAAGEALLERVAVCVTVPLGHGGALGAGAVSPSLRALGDGVPGGR